MEESVRLLRPGLQLAQEAWGHVLVVTWTAFAVWLT